MPCLAKSISMRHLDTNIVIAFLNGDKSTAAHLKAHLPEVAVSSLVIAELLYGARASVRSSENLEKVNQLLRVMDVVDFDENIEGLSLEDWRA